MPNYLKHHSGDKQLKSMDFKTKYLFSKNLCTIVSQLTENNVLS